MLKRLRGGAEHVQDGKYERDYLDYTDIIAVIPTHLRTDIVTPALIVQVSDRAIHELIWCPLQGHHVSVLVQGEVTWHGLHVVPLKQPQEQVFSLKVSFLVPSLVKMEGLDIYRLYKHIVFAKQQSHPAVLMQGLHVFSS